MDPPYALNIEDEVLTKIKENRLLDEDGFIIIEADLKRDFSFVSDMGFEITKIKQYKTNQHVFLREI
jgi:16S rRNA (guanine966-N2)-methyltransferase